MAEAAISAVLSKFGELAASEAKILLEVGDNMALLRDRLEWLQAFIRDADAKRRAGSDDRLTRVWVRQTRDAAFQAEDTLDKFVYQVDLKTQGYQGWEKIWHNLIGFCTQIISRHDFSARITRINMRLAKIAESQKEYDIKHTPLAPVTSSTTATSAWSDDVVGFDDDAASLWQLLLREDHQGLMFVSLLGESGVGKRTLVDSTVFGEKTKKFAAFWTHVPADSTVDVVLYNIYKTGLDMLGKTEENSGIDDITDKLRNLFAGIRYLVVITGIRSKTMLNCVRASLPDNKNGSRVLLILDTQNEELAWHANSLNQAGFNGIHMLSRLDEERSGHLFRSRAFRREVVGGRGDGSAKEDKMYDRIVYEITGGYPLAIVVLAGLLRFKERPGQWEAVLQQLRPASSMASEAPPVQGGSGNQQQIIEAKTSSSTASSSRVTTIERVFWASFEDLPNDLKSCLLYYAAHPENTSCNASGLVRSWMAEGFLKPQKGRTMEELGNNYIKELVLRCLVQIVQTDDYGGIEEVSVHPRLHGLLQSEAREARFMEVHDMHHAFVPPSVRRLSFVSLGGRYTPFTSKFPKLRTFKCWVLEEQRNQSSDGSQDTMNKQQHGHDLKFLCGSKFLRVVDVNGLRIEQLPDRICDMIHLRYLSVSNCKDLKELPPSIKRLLNLQTLDIMGTQVEMLDPGFWKIRTLRHVFAEKLTLPETIKEELPELQTLYGVKAPAAGWNKEPAEKCPLRKMLNLRALKLHGVAHDKHGAALASALTKMHLLGKLWLQGDAIPSCVFTAPSLRFLRMVDLDGTVEWPPEEFGWDATKVRPNLLGIKLRDYHALPQHISHEFDKIRVRFIH